MWVWSSFKYKDVERILIKLWCEYKYTPWWSHARRYNPKNWLLFHVVNHKAKEMKIWTLRWMLKKAGILEEDFLKHR